MYFNALILALMTLWRAVFMVYYGTGAELISIPGYVLKAFYMGVRFDLVIIAYINALVSLTLLVVLLVRRSTLFGLWYAALKYYYSAMYFIVFFILAVDFGFYSYFKNHINILIFGVFEDDTWALLSTFNDNYPLYLAIPIIIAMIGGLFFLARWILNCRHDDAQDAVESTSSYYRRISTGWFVLLLVNFAAARGSFGLFPLGTMHAEISPNLFVNQVAINGIFTLQQALEARMNDRDDSSLADELGYKDNSAQAFADYIGIDPAVIANGTPAQLVEYLKKTTSKNPALEARRPHVVLIMMEGFGSDLLRYHSPTFNVLGELEKHFKEDYLFTHFLSGDVGTIGSIETVVTNTLKRPGSKAITQSKYAFSTHITGAAVPFKRAGYQSYFMYGGNAAWRDIVALNTNAGFDATEGCGAMDPNYPQNQWGVYDEYLFDHIYRKLEKNADTPTFVFAMTTTNHPPYSLPEGYTLLPLTVPASWEKKITGDRQLAQLRFATYQYSNQKVGEFISRIKASPLGEHTIIAITGDHNFWSVFDYPVENLLWLDSVPLYVYLPPKLRPSVPVDRDTFGSHSDIMPTLYHAALSDAVYYAVGTNMLDPHARHIAYNADGFIMTRDAALRYTVANNTATYYQWEPPRSTMLVLAQATSAHESALKVYKAALVISEYLIKNADQITVSK